MHSSLRGIAHRFRGVTGGFSVIDTFFGSSLTGAVSLRQGGLLYSSLRGIARGYKGVTGGFSVIDTFFGGSLTRPASLRAQLIKGFADIHNHQFSYLGFGGIAFHGRAYGDPAEALPWCDFVQRRLPLIPIHGPGGTADFIGNLIKTFQAGGNTIGVFGHSVGGYPKFDGWPRWDSVTHQAVFEDWLHRAVVEGGLRLMVVLTVNNEYLCSRVNTVLSCNDMEAVDRQLAAAKEMEAYVDDKFGGPGQGWYRIVYSPYEAREVIQAGKLAVVLGTEVDYLFNCHNEGDLTDDQLREQLEKYYALGVRHVFPIHFSDNGFGGTALQNMLEHARAAEAPLDPALEIVLNPGITNVVAHYDVLTEDARAFGYEYRTGRRNVQGLTDLGKTLIREMITRGMIIDVDHMSARSKADVFDICERADYPVVSGHAGFVEISHGDKAHEGQLLPQEMERIRKLGGMVAPITHQGNKLDEITTWEGPGQPKIPHNCANTSNTLVQAYLYAVSKMQGAPVALGTDFNGLINAHGPRFGADYCPGNPFVALNIPIRVKPPQPSQVSYPFTAAATGNIMDRSVVGEKTFDFNFDGLAHVGMLPDLIADFQAQGLSQADLDPLLNSAHGYVTLWEKSWRHGWSWLSSDA
jgi:microsomal dipeptidase-like Zn-dependent dipeptidase